VYCDPYHRINISVKTAVPEPPPAYLDGHGGLYREARWEGSLANKDQENDKLSVVMEYK